MTDLNLSPDFRDNLLNWLARREQDLRSQIKTGKSDKQELLKGELIAVMETTAFVLTDGCGF